MKIPNVVFKNDDLNNILLGVGLEQVKSIVFDKFIPNLEIAIKKNKKECIYCTSHGFDVVLPKSEFKKAIDTIEKYYIKKENYIICSKLRDLAIQIKL